MRLFICLLFLAIMSIATGQILAYLFLDLGGHLHEVMNLTYILCVTVAVTIGRSGIFSEGRSIVLAPFAVVATGALAMWIGGSVYAWSPLLGHILMTPGTLGYYPDGSDMPFSFGVSVWSFSILGMTFVALFAGGALRMLKRRNDRRTDPRMDN